MLLSDFGFLSAWNDTSESQGLTLFLACVMDGTSEKEVSRVAGGVGRLRALKLGDRVSSSSLSSKQFLDYLGGGLRVPESSSL